MEIVKLNDPKIIDWSRHFYNSFGIKGLLDTWMSKQVSAFPANRPKPISQKKHALFINHDFQDAQDRRVLQFIPLIEELGYQVTVQCLARPDSHKGRVDLGLNINPVPDRLKIIPVTLDRFAGSPFSDPILSKFKTSILRPTMLMKNRSVPARAIRRLYSKIPFIVKKIETWTSTQNVETESLRQVESNPMPLTESFIRPHLNSKQFFDLIVVADLPSLPAAVVLSKVYGCQLIYDSHELYPEQVVFERGKQLLLSLWEQWAIAQADLVFTVSRQAAAFMQTCYSTKQPIAYFSNATAVSTQSVKPNTKGVGPLRERMGLTKKETVILYNGGVSTFRNIEVLINAFSFMNDDQFFLAILGYGELEYARELAQKLPKKNVWVFPAVNHSEMINWVLDADAIVIPYPAVDHNTRNCTPNKLFDAIEFGIPLLANQDLDTLKEIFEEFSIGIQLDFSSSERLAADLKKVDQNRMKEKIDQRNFSTARDSLAWPNQISLIRKAMSTLKL